MMHRLIIRHVGDGETCPCFVVMRAADHTDADPAEVPSPVGYPVEGQGQHDLMHELRWYLETYLDYPFEPWTTRATRLLAARQQWGRAAFDALFHGGLGRDFYTEATRGGEDQLTLEIRSDDPKVLSWPWEALENAKTSLPLALACQFERRLTKLELPPELGTGLSRDCVRILLVIARPYEQDVGFRSIARPLIEQLESRSFPAEVTVLRPPTFERLQEVLEQNPDTFHILHFDGHGGYGSAADGSGVPHQFKGPEGRLVFEDDHGKPAPVAAHKLGALLRRHKLPAVVLNACQAAMVDEHAEDAFASVAAALLRGGVRSVVAMAYSLYVSAAQVFMPAFYRRLFETGDIGRATQDGRRRMFEQRERVCVRGRHTLEDWMIPVLYQQAKLDFAFVQNSHVKAEPKRHLPQAVDDSQNPYGFVGRDSTLLELERAMRRKPAGLLVHGLGGVGKTTLARGFLKWLSQTHGLGMGVLWVDFRDVRSAEYVVNEMLGPLAGTNALALPITNKLEGLKQLLNDNAVLVVWDNFESARGIEGNMVEGSLPAEDQQTLARLLSALRGGKSKVLLTSRSEERWLGGPETCTRVLLGGLTGEERWTFCQRILDDLGLVVDRTDAEQVELMEKLGGHPLLMRAVVPKLESMTAGAIAKVVESNLAAMVDGKDELGAKVLATLGFVEQSLSAELIPLLIPLSLHEHFVEVEDLEAMGADVPGEWSRGRIDALLGALTVAGLVTRRGPEVFELHPALTTYLRSRGVKDERENAWQRGFVDTLARLANAFAPRELHEQRPVFHVHLANFRRALIWAQMLTMSKHVAALTQSLAVYAHNMRDFAAARTLYQEVAEYGARERDAAMEGGAYHQLGIVAQQQRDFDVAEYWFRKSLAIKENQGNEHGTASTYHQLGRTAQQQRDFDAAERWFLMSLAICEKQGIEYGAAKAYHNLGTLAQEKRDFDAAERWVRKSLALCEKQGDEHGAAMAYHQLGIVAEEQRDFDAAERWFRKALATFEKQGDELTVAVTYHHLGTLAQRQRDFDAAERWYRKALATFEKQGDEHHAAMSYHNLGTVALEQQDFDAAERWFRKSLAISEKQGDEYQAAMSYHNLGTVAQQQRNFDAAERWHRKSLAISEKQGDEHGAAGTYHQLGIVAQHQGDFDAAECWFRKSLAISEKQGNEHDAAGTCHQLGIVALERQDFETARDYFIRAATSFARTGAPHEFSIVQQSVVYCEEAAPEPSKSKLRRAWEAAGFEWPAI